jgi:hypothetical protein
MMTVYGDDLYYVDYNASKPGEGEGKKNAAHFRVRDYGYAHTLFHFTDGARLESRQQGVLDKLVLSGPNNGDDRFYVVDLAAGGGLDWKSQAKTIDTAAVGGTDDGVDADGDGGSEWIGSGGGGGGRSAGGVLGNIRSTLETLVLGIEGFQGVGATSGEETINWIMPINNTATGWKLDDADMEVRDCFGTAVDQFPCLY